MPPDVFQLGPLVRQLTAGLAGACHGVAIPGRVNGSMLYSTRASTAGHTIEDGTHRPSMASSGIDFTGLIAVLPLGTMGSLTQGVVVTKHGAGAASFAYKPPAGALPTRRTARDVCHARTLHGPLLHRAQHGVWGVCWWERWHGCPSPCHAHIPPPPPPPPFRHVASRS